MTTSPDYFDVFAQGMPFDGPIDLDYFENIPNKDIAERALAFLNDQANEFDLRKYHAQSDITRLWRATFRACIRYQVSLTAEQHSFALRLGVVVP